jgi:hypothetical protein
MHGRSKYFTSFPHSPSSLLCNWKNAVGQINYGNCSIIHSFHWHVQNATIPCRSQELLPFHYVM